MVFNVSKLIKIILIKPPNRLLLKLDYYSLAKLNLK